MIGNSDQPYIDDKVLSEEDRRVSAAEQLHMDYLATFSDPRGKRVLDDLSKFGLVDQDCFCPDSFSRTAFALGARSVVLHIRDMMDMVVDKDRQQKTDQE